MKNEKVQEKREQEKKSLKMGSASLLLFFFEIYFHLLLFIIFSGPGGHLASEIMAAVLGLPSIGCWACGGTARAPGVHSNRNSPEHPSTAQQYSSDIQLRSASPPEQNSGRSSGP